MIIIVVLTGERSNRLPGNKNAASFEGMPAKAETGMTVVVNQKVVKSRLPVWVPGRGAANGI